MNRHHFCPQCEEQQEGKYRHHHEVNKGDADAAEFIGEEAAQRTGQRTQ